ncbi:hypothetical protein SETIT_4G252500v2 [Setaria italica]|uniref:DUF834 domain-containing protein n=1 Tax=Setaria italica TaxID=4555 RepID=A0A368QY20_SETIT|nr:hypothetical protein SETIT_4G252500v2 [Setaria italica]
MAASLRKGGGGGGQGATEDEDGGGDGEGSRVSAAVGCGRGGKTAGASRPASEQSRVTVAVGGGGEFGGAGERAVWMGMGRVAGDRSRRRLCGEEGNGNMVVGQRPSQVGKLGIGINVRKMSGVEMAGDVVMMMDMRIQVEKRYEGRQWRTAATGNVASQRNLGRWRERDGDARSVRAKGER